MINRRKKKAWSCFHRPTKPKEKVYGHVDPKMEGVISMEKMKEDVTLGEALPGLSEKAACYKKEALLCEETRRRGKKEPAVGGKSIIGGGSGGNPYLVPSKGESQRGETYFRKSSKERTRLSLTRKEGSPGEKGSDFHSPERGVKHFVV